MFRNLMLTCSMLLLATLAYYRDTNTSAPADLKFVNQTNIHTLDPQQMSWTSDIRVCLNVWEGLTQPDSRTLQPAAGAAFLPPQVSEDQLVYKFHLRKVARWSNGDPVTAGDFVRGWRRAIEPGTAADYASLLLDHIAGVRAYYDWRNQAVKRLGEFALPSESDAKRAFLNSHAAEMDTMWEMVGIKAKDQHTLHVTLTRPTPYFLELTSLPVMMPIHESIELLREQGIAPGIDDNGLVVYDSQWTKPDYHRNGYPGLVTNGTYNIREWQFRRKLRLEVNRMHYDHQRARLNTIDIIMYENANTAFQAYETGVVDWLTNLNVDYAGALLSKSAKGRRQDVSVVPAFGTYFYNLNCRDEFLPDGRRNPFTDVRVRKAFCISVDRDQLCARVAEKQNPPITSLIPAGTIAGYPGAEGQAYDAIQAATLLDEAGYADRSIFPDVSILYNTSTTHARLAEAIAEMWRRNLGIVVRLQSKETKTFANDKAKHNFHIARASWYGDYADPTTFLDIFATDNGNNDSGFSDAHYDDLLRRAANCLQPQRRMQILAQAESYLVNQAFPLIPIYQYTNPQAFRKYVHGIHPNPREIYLLRDVWVSK